MLSSYVVPLSLTQYLTLCHLSGALLTFKPECPLALATDPVPRLLRTLATSPLCLKFDVAGTTAALKRFGPHAGL